MKKEYNLEKWRIYLTPILSKDFQISLQNIINESDCEAILLGLKNLRYIITGENLKYKKLKINHTNNWRIKDTVKYITNHNSKIFQTDSETIKLVSSKIIFDHLDILMNDLKIKTKK